MSHRPSACLAIAVCAAALSGCDALTQFRTEPGEIFNGEVVGSDRDSHADEDSLIREGFISHTQMDLSFDPFDAKRQLNGSNGVDKPQSPGVIDTYVCRTSKRPCPSAQRMQGEFQKAKLEQFVRLNQDALSQYDFPGGGRLRNYIFGARFESPLGSGTVARNATVFLSLMDNGRIEVRVISSSVLDPATGDAALPGLFGVFVLARHTE